MRKFCVKSSVKRSYEDQGYIHFVCQNYVHLSAQKQEYIRTLAGACAGHQVEALMDVLTADSGIHDIMHRRFIASVTSIYRPLRKFYENFCSVEEFEALDRKSKGRKAVNG